MAADVLTKGLAVRHCKLALLLVGKTDNELS